MTITLDLPAELEGPVRQAARTQGKDISTFLLDSVRQRVRPDILPEPEAKLLQIINAPVAPEARAERDALLAKESLTNAEQTELTRLIDEVEMANARRWQSIAELAQRRSLSLPEIAAELEIPLS